jgi:hypothetical protein
VPAAAYFAITGDVWLIPFVLVIALGHAVILGLPSFLLGRSLGIDIAHPLPAKRINLRSLVHPVASGIPFDVRPKRAPVFDPSPLPAIC